MNTNDCEILQEVVMTPSVLAKFATTPEAKSIVVGAEFELYLEGALSVVPEAPSFDEHITFDEIENYLYPNDSDTMQKIVDTYEDWRSNAIERYISENSSGLIVSYLFDNYEEKLLKHYATKHGIYSEEEVGEIIAGIPNYPNFTSSSEFNEKAPENQKKYAKLSNNVEKELLALEDSEEIDEYLTEALGEVEGWASSWYDFIMDKITDAAVYENSQGYGAYEFFVSLGISDISDVADSFGGEEASSDWDGGVAKKLGVELSKAIGYDVEVYSEYKDSDSEGWENRGVWVIEPDSSVTGHGRQPSDLGLEIKSPPVKLIKFLEDFDKFVTWAKAKNGYTTKNTGLHLNMSIPNQGDVDYLKLVLFAGADKVSEDFDRAANLYAKSNLSLIKDLNAVKDKEKIANVMALLKVGLANKAWGVLREFHYDKYVQINFKDSYVEFRAPGNDWLGKFLPKVKETLYRFAYALMIASDPNAHKEEYAKKITKLLSGSSEDDLAPFVQYASGQIDKQRLKTQIQTRMMYRKMRFDPAKMSVEDFKQIFKENGLHEFKLKSLDDRKFYTVKAENLTEVINRGSMDNVLHKYVMTFERENEDPALVDTLQLVYYSKQGTTEILGLTDKF